MELRSSGRASGHSTHLKKGKFPGLSGGAELVNAMRMDLPGFSEKIGPV